MTTFKSLALMTMVLSTCAVGSFGGPPKLFPTDAPSKQWATFKAEGFSKPACGVVYRLNEPVSCGMPLGGIDVGCVDLETTGLLGFCTLFNTHIPRRGPINLPVLGVSVGGQTWVLCKNQPKQHMVAFGWSPEGASKSVEPGLDELNLQGVKTAQEIHYWGHYPIADLEFDTDCPVSVGLRAWSPFLPGDLVGSMMPTIVFEAHLRNTSSSSQTGTVAFSFPGPTANEAGRNVFSRSTVKGNFTGAVVDGRLASCAMGVVGRDSVRLGGELAADGAAWAAIEKSLPAAKSDSSGNSAAVDFSLAPGKEKVVRFVFTWYAPTWNGGGYNWIGDQPQWKGQAGHVFTHMYAKYYPNARQTAEKLAKDHKSILKRILAWQQVVYTDNKLPVWLRDSLVNMLHLITEDGYWAQKAAPLPAWVTEDGLFGLNECPRGYPQIECIPCSFYGNIPLVYFFPKLAYSTLTGYKGYQDAEGSPPWVFGGPADKTPPIDFAYPTRGYQVTLNGDCYIDMFDRYLMCSGDQKALKDFWPSLKKSLTFTMGLNRGPDGVISMPDRSVSVIDVGNVKRETEWFEFYEWNGMVSHVGGIHLATLRMAQRMAEQVGDSAFAAKCRRWIESGQNSLENKLWNGSYYLNWLDEATGKKSDLVFGYQLDGEWMARFHGLPGVFKQDRVKTVLDTLEKLNVPPTKYGALNYVHPDGTVLKSGEFPMKGFYAPYDFFSPEVMMLGMTYMYDGRSDFGLELTRRCMYNITVEQRTVWDMPNIISGDTGKRSFGNDYYQNMMLWSLPAAMDGKDITGPCKPGGLVDRVITAASGSAE